MKLYLIYINGILLDMIPRYIQIQPYMKAHGGLYMMAFGKLMVKMVGNRLNKL